MSENFRAFWDEALRQIGEEYRQKGQEGDFRLWFNMEYVGDEGNEITVNVPSAFFWMQQVGKGYVSKVEEVLATLTGQEISLRHLETNRPVSGGAGGLPVGAAAEGNAQPGGRAAPEGQAPAGSGGTEDFLEQARADYNADRSLPSRGPSGSAGMAAATGMADPTGTAAAAGGPAPGEGRGSHPLLSDEFTFDSFVKGDNNDYAYSSCLAIARNPGQAKLFNPLLLYGGSGLGKTHLMQAVGNYIWRNNSEPLKICYTTTENFLNEFNMALKTNIADKFTKKYRSYDVFLLDDIHFLLGKQGLQEAIFNTFDGLKSHNAQMVFTCDRPLNELKGLEERLRSRIGSGAAIDMAPPQFETRCAILQKKLDLMEKELPEEVISYIAKNVQSNVRDLEGCLKKVVGYAELTGQMPDVAKTQNLLRDNFVEASMDSISMEAQQQVHLPPAGRHLHRAHPARLLLSRAGGGVRGPRPHDDDAQLREDLRPAQGRRLPRGDDKHAHPRGEGLPEVAPGCHPTGLPFPATLLPVW